MSIDKALYQAPQGVAATDAPDVEIIIEGEPEATVEITVDDETEDFGANLAELISEKELQSLIADLDAEVEADEKSRADWEKMYKDGITLLGLKYEERTEPWPGACGVFHPMITEAVVRFQADTIMETFPAEGPVKTKIVGKQTKEKDDAAARVREDMNWQVTENMVEFRPEHERMLWTLPGAGSAFKKVYRDPALGRQTSVFVPPEDVILPYGTTDMVTTPRVTHKMRKTEEDVLRFQYSGFWLDVELGEPAKVTDDVQKRKDKETGFSSLNDSRYVIKEVIVDLDLPGFEDKDKDGKPTGLPLPYVVTYDHGTKHCLAIRRNWNEDDKKRQRRLHYVHYQYIPGFGAYGFGLFHLIGGYAKSATSIIRQLVDAGTLSNLPGGLKTKGLRVKGDDTPIQPGEFRDVDVGSGSIHDNIMTLPYKEPSQVLAGLLERLIEEARRFAATSDVKTSDMSSQAPVGTTLAILERTLKVMTAVQARVHFAFKQELRLIAEFVREDSPANEEYSYDVDAPNGRKAKYEDYRHVEIIPVSDPNAATMSQRIIQYQAVIQLSQTAPQIYDLPELHRQMLQVLGLKNAQKLVPTIEDQKPTDPVQENQNALAMKPIKAFAYQDHESHIRVHMMAMQDPIVQKLVGQNPQAQGIMAAMQAHIAEHVGFAYRNRMAQALGAPLPEYDKEDGLPEEVELQLSKLLAQAAPQVMAASQAMAAQQQAQQNAQDPLLQAQIKELQIKEKEAATKEMKVKADVAARADELRLKEEEMAMRERIAGAQIGAQAQGKKLDISSRQEAEGLRMGIDAAKHRADVQQRTAQTNKPQPKAKK